MSQPPPHPRPHGRSSRSPADPETGATPGRRVILLCLFALAAALAADGVKRLGTMRSDYLLALARTRATSPVPYGRAMRALRRLAPDGASGPTAIVRADSAGAERERLCALAADPPDGAVVLVVLSAAVEPCLAGRAVSPPAELRSALGAELARARWVVLAGDGTVLHSGRSAPAPDAVRETLAMFAPTGGGA